MRGNGSHTQAASSISIQNSLTPEDLNMAYTQKYRVRATIKLSPSGENLDIKSEAQYGGQSGWKSGFDDRLLQTLKSDISGVIGRVAR